MAGTACCPQHSWLHTWGGSGSASETAGRSCHFEQHLSCDCPHQCWHPRDQAPRPPPVIGEHPAFPTTPPGGKGGLRRHRLAAPRRDPPPQAGALPLSAGICTAARLCMRPGASARHARLWGRLQEEGRRTAPPATHGNLATVPFVWPTTERLRNEKCTHTPSDTLAECMRESSRRGWRGSLSPRGAAEEALGARGRLSRSACVIHMRAL